MTHLVYAAVHELPGLVRGWSSPEQMATNLAMLRNVLDPIVTAGHLEHVTLLQGTKAYGVHQHCDPHPGPGVRAPRPARQLLLVAGGPRPRVRRTHRVLVDDPEASTDRGSQFGVAMNLPPVLAAYAAIRRAEGLPFSYPGGPSYVAEAVDARIVGEACVWAATAESARDEHFNITNGDVYEWRDLWPSLAEALRVETGPDERFRLSAYLRERSAVWDDVVRRHGLRPLTLGQLVGHSDQYADFQLVHSLDQPPPPALMSTVKIRRAGFGAAMDTVDTFRHAIEVLQARGVTPVQ